MCVSEYCVEWDTNLGTLHKLCTAAEVFEFTKSVSKLGFTPRVEMLDAPVEK